MTKESIRKVAVALAADQDRLLSRKETSAITGRSYSSMWRDERAGRFPQRRRKGTKSIGYLLSEVMAWMQSLEIVNEGTIRPVATPGPGKKRGRGPSNKAEDVKKAEAGVVIVDHAVKQFKAKMRRAGLTPPKKIMADGRLHWVHVIEEPLVWYIFDASHPAVGLYGCNEKLPRKWVIKKVDALSDQEKEVLEEKLARLRKMRDEALKGEEVCKPAS